MIVADFRENIQQMSIIFHYRNENMENYYFEGKYLLRKFGALGIILYIRKSIFEDFITRNNILI